MILINYTFEKRKKYVIEKALGDTFGKNCYHLLLLIQNMFRIKYEK